MTTIATTVKEIRSMLPENRRIGFVPTMGNLHLGHLELIRRSQQDNELTIVSSFVNPTQFNDKDDLKHYPRTDEDDFVKLEKENVDILFKPEERELYPDDYHFRVLESDLSQIMEGEHRKSHFQGVLTIVLKLLQIVRPTRAYFGEKDYQQYLLIKGLAKAFFLETEICSCPTIRDQDGLALSSRNQRLSSEDRKKAAHFPRLLGSTNKSCDTVSKELEDLGFSVDYISESRERRFGAVRIGKVRLIDNIAIDEIK